VLDVKTKQEQAKRTELFRLTERLAETRRALLTQQRILRNIILSITENRPKNRIGEQEFFLKYSTTSDERIKLLKNKIGELEIEQRKKINEVLKARQFKEGLERLRAEAKKRFIKEQEKLEQKQLDDGATISFARKKGALSIARYQEKSGD
jgi:flagellar biosynthesis chaperone FliJ